MVADLAGAAQAGEPDAEALLMARRIHLAQDLGRLGPGEPLGQQFALGEIVVADLRAGDVERLRARGHILAFHVAVFIGQVDQLLEGDHLDADLVLIELHRSWAS